MTVRIGIQISHYKIVEKLGEGGMGVLYKAEDKRLSRTVAIKFLSPQLTQDPDAKDRFIREAQTASALDHLNICTIHEIDETEDGQLFMVMTYYEGEPLDIKLKRQTLSLEDALNYAIQIAHGLSNAHANGIVHRDIKPSNIMVTNEGIIKILDFGLAKLKVASELTRESSTLGTLHYMSPEQVLGKHVDSRSDIWSVGIVLYEMITGQLPFKGDYDPAIIYAIFNEVAQPLDELNPEVPNLLERIVFKALAKQPDCRYQHIIEMLKELEQVKDKGEDIPLQPKNRLKRKTRMIYLSVVTLLIIVFAVFYISYSPSTSAENNNLITVLPFENLNSDGGNDYFSDGITEDIITLLSKIRELRVISFSSSKLYKGSDKSIQTIGAELGVTHILHGKVRREGNQVKINATLTELKTLLNLWSETYDGKISDDGDISDIFAIQSEVAEKIALALEVELTNSEKEYIGKEYTNNLSAYEYYLKGREYYYRYRADDNDAAIQLFKQAVEFEPKFALAYAGLADAYVQKTLRYGSNSSWLDTAIQKSKNALHIDPTLAEAHKALGLVYYTRSWFQKSLSENRRALELSPNYDPAIANLGSIYLNLGELDQALYYLHTAQKLNPTNPSITMGLGTAYLNLCDYNQSVYWLTNTIKLQAELKPNPIIQLMMIDILQGKQNEALAKCQQILTDANEDAAALAAAGDIVLQSGNPSLASAFYEKALVIDPKVWNPLTGINLSTSLGFLFWKMEQKEKAQELLTMSINADQLTLKQGCEWWGIAYDLAAVNSILEMKQEAVKWLQKAFDSGFRLHNWLQVDPLFENIRSERSFLDLSAKIEAEIARISSDL
jgi:serine/threonine protein kinase/Flp pilus assembly protein TadD